MAKKDYDALAASVIDKVGGKENIASVRHCITRLRFILKDESIAKDDEIRGVQHVMDVVKGGGEYQVVIGPDVGDAYDAAIKILGPEFAGGEAKVDASAEDKKDEKKSFSSRCADLVSSIFMPVIGGMCGVGLLKVFLILFTNLGILSTESGVYTIMSAGADAFMYFLPFALAYSAAERFKCNKYTALAVVAPLLFSTITTAYAEQQQIFFGPIPVTLVNYGNSVIPAVVGVWLLSVLERSVNKLLPKSLQFFLTPTICVTIMVPVLLIAIGPATLWLGNAFADAFLFVYELQPMVASIIYGAFYPLLIIFGAHWALMPIMMNNFAVLGYDWLTPLSFGCAYAIAGACFAVFLKTKNKHLKEMAGPNTAIAVVGGVTEPAIYGVVLKYKKPFICACIGSGVGSAFIATAGFQRIAMVGFNLFSIPAFMTFPGGWCIPWVVISSFVVAFVLTYIWGFKDSMIPESEREPQAQNA